MNKINIGKIHAKGGLKKLYQDITIQAKLGIEPKIGITTVLRDNLTHKVMQKPVQTMFNMEEINKIDKLIELLKGGKEMIIDYQKHNKQRRLI